MTNVSFPIFGLHEKWGLASQCCPGTGCVALGSHAGRSEEMEHHAGREKLFSGTLLLLSVCSTCAVLHVFTQLQSILIPVPSSAGSDTVISLLFSLLE